MDSGSGSSEDKDGQHDTLLAFPESMLGALDEFATGLDDADFECVSYVNRLFPTEQSLAGLETAAAKCEYGAQNAERALAGLVRGAGERRAAGAAALQAAGEGATRLAARLKAAEERAGRSANTVRDVTAEIKALDAAKTNLAVAITALHHCRLLADAAATLPALVAARDYKELVMPLQACSQVLQQFESYRDIPLIESLRTEVERVRRSLGPQILQECGAALAAGGEWRALGDACGAADAVGVGPDVLTQLLRAELREYGVLFAASEEDATLDRIERRYAWLKKRLLAFEQGRARVLPASWDASRALARMFCEDTRRALAELLGSRAADLDVRSLLHAVTKTRAFELLLHRRFDGEIPPNATVIPSSAADRNATQTGQGAGGGAGGGEGEVVRSPWLGAIGDCLEPHLSLYIRSLDGSLRALMDEFVKPAPPSPPPGPPPAPGADEAEAGVLSSCAELFVFYKKCLLQCAQLSTGEPMVELSSLFGSYLREYAGRVLSPRVPTSDPGGVAALLLRREERRDPAPAHVVRRLTAALATADYCAETTARLHDKLRARVVPGLAHKVDLRGEADMFRDVAESCVREVARGLERAALPALEGPPPCAPALARALTPRVATLRARLAACRRYLLRALTLAADAVGARYVRALLSASPAHPAPPGPDAVRALLHDAHNVKALLLELPNAGTAVSRAVPASYSRVVLRHVSRAEAVCRLAARGADGDPLDATWAARLAHAAPDLTRPEVRGACRLAGGAAADIDALVGHYERAAREARTHHAHDTHGEDAPA